ncbi:hypothetical protein HI914_03802 [Erysiphe necator]|nr:hypothetical protein HI914_03802 [Erysiphe necator]
MTKSAIPYEFRHYNWVVACLPPIAIVASHLPHSDFLSMTPAQSDETYSYVTSCSLQTPQV